MKKIIICATLFFITVSTAIAQNGVDAKTILDGISTKYHSYSNVRIEYTTTVSLAKYTYVQNNTIIMTTKGDKYRMTTYSPENKNEISDMTISDGRKEWSYNPEINEAKVDDVEDKDDSLSPTIWVDMYKQGYEYVLAGTINLAGNIYEVIDLRPQGKSQMFSKIRIQIDKAKQQIFKITGFSKDGTPFIICNITSYTPNVSTNDDTFIFNKKDFPGSKVVKSSF